MLLSLIFLDAQDSSNKALYFLYLSLDEKLHRWSLCLISVGWLLPAYRKFSDTSICCPWSVHFGWQHVCIEALGKASLSDMAKTVKLCFQHFMIWYEIGMKLVSILSEVQLLIFCSRLQDQVMGSQFLLIKIQIQQFQSSYFPFVSC